MSFVQSCTRDIKSFYEEGAIHKACVARDEFFIVQIDYLNPFYKWCARSHL
jgi:hypothetical protein